MEEEHSQQWQTKIYNLENSNGTVNKNLAKSANYVGLNSGGLKLYIRMVMGWL